MRRGRPFSTPMCRRAGSRGQRQPCATNGSVRGGGGPRPFRWARLIAAFATACAVAGCGGASTSDTPTQTRTNTAKHQAISFPALVAKVRSGVIRIESTTCDGESIGTGFLISPRLVATVEHVVDGAVAINLKRGSRTIAHGTVIGNDASRDVALVRLSRSVPGYVFTLSARSPELGENVAAMGFPLDLPLSVTRGSVSGSGRNIPIGGETRHNLVQTDAAVNPGNSGGPLFASNGDVVGLIDLGTNQAQGLAFAVSSRVAAPLLEAWRTSPQPVGTTQCDQTPLPASDSAPSSPPSTESGVSTFDGSYFSIDYPSTWVIKSKEKKQSYGYDTTIADPADSTRLLRVDVTPGVSSSDPLEIARPVIQAVRQTPGYSEIGLTRETFNGYDALHWEFVDKEAGQFVHKEDEFFVDQNGDGFAVLTEAAAADYPDLTDTFAQLRSSLSTP